MVSYKKLYEELQKQNSELAKEYNEFKISVSKSNSFGKDEVEMSVVEMQKNLQTIIEKMWGGSNVKDNLFESCNETYSNTPIHIFREYFKSYFGSEKIKVMYNPENESKIIKFIQEIQSNIELELGAWKNTLELFEQYFPNKL